MKNLYLNVIGGMLLQSLPVYGAGLLNTNIVSVAVDVTRRNIVYATASGCPNGGVYQSVDSGENWSNKTAGFGCLDTHDVTVDATNGDVVYAAVVGQGVFKSSNSGTSWTLVTSALGIIDAREVTIDPINPNVLYVTTKGQGLFKSTNAGSSWTAINSGLTSTDFRGPVVVDFRSPSTTYVGAYVGNGLFRSVSAGSSWTQVFTCPASVLGMEIEPCSTPTKILAGTIGNGIYKSTNGTTWTPSGLSGLQVHALAAAPAGSNVIFAGTSTGVYKSTDGGTSWTVNGPNTMWVKDISIDPNAVDVLYTAVNSTGAGGVYKTTDGGITWVRKQ